MAKLGQRMTDEPAPEHRASAEAPRTMLERVALAAIALLVAALFGGLGVAALAGGEVFLGVMGGIGALMTVWAAASNLRRG
jgi:hypothetical protein